MGGGGRGAEGRRWTLSAEIPVEVLGDADLRADVFSSAPLRALNFNTGNAPRANCSSFIADLHYLPWPLQWTSGKRTLSKCNNVNTDSMRRPGSIPTLF